MTRFSNFSCAQGKTFMALRQKAGPCHGDRPWNKSSADPTVPNSAFITRNATGNHQRNAASRWESIALFISPLVIRDSECFTVHNLSLAIVSLRALNRILTIATKRRNQSLQLFSSRSSLHPRDSSDTFSFCKRFLDMLYRFSAKYPFSH